MALFKLLITAVALLQFVEAHIEFKSRIPNGDRVPNPCPEGTFWSGVGHQSPAGANARNPFGMDFKAAGLQWTVDLCRKDSDGDGLTNGQELGDPDCVWTIGAAPARTTSLSHPGICPLDSATCKNSWTVCPKAFSCPAMDEAGVTVRNFTLSETAVPPKETTHMCQAFELNNTASPVHMIGSRPIIVNRNVVQHMIMYACSTRPTQTWFDAPQNCFMGYKNCTEILNVWTYGIEGVCFNKNAGFRVGGQGFRYGLLRLNWNNPRKTTGYTDASGFSIYFTSNLRRYDQGTLLNGELSLVLPPRQPLVNYNHTCPSVCTNAFHKETRYITAVAIHMHNYGTRGRVSLWRNGALVKELVPMQVYDYNSPGTVFFDTPVEYRRGDEVKTECYYNTLTSNQSIFFGYGRNDEMCLSVMHYYPNNLLLSPQAKLSECTAYSGINTCWFRTGVTPPIVNGCNVTSLLSGDTLTKLLNDLFHLGCLQQLGCPVACRNYMNYTLFPSNACFDPKRSLHTLEALHIGRFKLSPRTSMSTYILGVSYPVVKMCQKEIEMLPLLEKLQMSSQGGAVGNTVPPVTCSAVNSPPSLKSEHLLIIIVVCSCLAFALLVAILIFVGRRCNGRLQQPPMLQKDQESVKADVYKVYT